MSTESNCCHIVKGSTNYYLKCGKEKLAKALTLKELENKIRNELGALEEYLIALDIFRTKNPGLV